MLKTLVLGSLVALAGSYALPYNYFTMNDGTPIGTWAIEVIEAHIVTLLAGVALIPAALAWRGKTLGRAPRTVMGVFALLALLAVGATAADYFTGGRRSAGPSFYVQVLAVLGTLGAASLAARPSATATGQRGPA